jgi:UDP-2-acetamido-2-deoxy-ribo-hexuluronate aminotransferase
VLLAKLDVFDDELAARERISRIYDAILSGHIAIPARVPDSASAWAIYAILLRDAASREKAQAALRDSGIPTAIYYPRPLHHQPAYAPHHRGNPLPVSEDLATRILALPIHPDLTEAQARRVAESVLAAT